MDIGEAALDDVEQFAVLERRHLRVDPALHAHFRGAARDRVGHLGEDLMVGMIVGVGLPALPLEAAELASDKADVGEVDIAVDDVGDFVADVLRAREVRALHHRAQIVAFRGVEREPFVGREFAALDASLQRGAHGRGRAGEKSIERCRLDLIDPVSPVVEIHGAPPTVRAHIARTLVATAGSSHSSVIYSG
jgi:hypothetical protein